MSRGVLETRSKLSIDPVDELRIALLEARRGPTSLFSDIWKLGRSPCRLTIEEYFLYRLHVDDHSERAKHRFLGEKSQDRIFNACTDSRWIATAHDKALSSMVLSSAGLPTPETIALYAPGRSVPGARSLSSTDEVRKFLQNEALFPLFGKPVEGMYSEGVVALEEYHAEDDVLETSLGEKVEVDTFLEELLPFNDSGYLFQRRLKNHYKLEEIGGSALATVRMVILLSRSDIHVLTAVLKIPGSGNIADNFWREGNILCAVDRESGLVRRAISGVGSHQEVHETYPGSNAPLTGWSIPFWEDIQAISKAAASMFSGIRMQAWDIAVTDEGPYLLELNIGGDFLLPQLAHGRGLLDEEFRSFLEGNKFADVLG